MEEDCQKYKNRYDKWKSHENKSKICYAFLFTLGVAGAYTIGIACIVPTIILMGVFYSYDKTKSDDLYEQMQLAFNDLQYELKHELELYKSDIKDNLSQKIENCKSYEYTKMMQYYAQIDNFWTQRICDNDCQSDDQISLEEFIQIKVIEVKKHLDF